MAGTHRGNAPEFRVLLGERRIRAGVQALARRIGKDYRGTVPVFVGILNGSFVFLADLLREMDLECEVEFLRLSSYRAGGTKPGKMRLLRNLDVSLKDREVVVVEDVIDSGRSIRFVRNLILRHKPKSVRVVTLLLKAETAPTAAPEYVGFRIPSDFVAGYGLDYSGRMRNKRSIYRLARPE